jgi:hypothetical protein
MSWDEIRRSLQSEVDTACQAIARNYKGIALGQTPTEVEKMINRLLEITAQPGSGITMSLDVTEQGGVQGHPGNSTSNIMMNAPRLSRSSLISTWLFSGTRSRSASRKAELSSSENSQKEGARLDREAR